MTQGKIIHLIAAARPNFMKIAPLYHELRAKSWCEPVIVHTGQHYDLNMSDAIFRDLGLPEPDIHLGIGSGTHAEQTAKVMVAYEKVLLNKAPDLVVVVGDVNSTMAAALAAVKLGVKVAHLEAGLRSLDKSMPEEINRIVTDRVADILWTPSKDGDENLLREGVARENVEMVGNIMIDSLEMMRNRIESTRAFAQFGVEPNSYALITLHRPSNVDDSKKLEKICAIFKKLAEKLPIVFPVHPRTRKNLASLGLMDDLEHTAGVYLSEPLSYVPFMSLVFNARLVITDSGGIQEETTYLGIPCLTLRPNTERPVTVMRGTNRLCSADNLLEYTWKVLNSRKTITDRPEYWDGKTAERIANSIKRILCI